MSWDAVFPPGPQRWQVAAIAFSGDGRAITAASLDTPDGTRLAAATPDAIVRLWDTRTWTLAATLTPEDPGEDH